MAVDPHVEKLLILQDRDIRSDEIRRRLTELPAEIQSFEARIAAELAAVEEARGALKRSELKRREFEQRITKTEDDIRRFRTQQLSVKKNEEYRALETEIENAQAAIGQLENEALETMMQIDEDLVTLKKREEQSREILAELRGHIERLRLAESAFRQDLSAADAAVAQAREGIPERVLSVYRYVRERVRRPPYVTPVEEQRCSGCHIKVSHTTMASLRNPNELSRCENCSRIVYLP